MTTKYLNQAKLSASVTPTNSAIAAGDSGQTVAEKLQGQINAFPVVSGLETVFNGLENPALFAVTYSASDRKFTVTASTGAAYTVGGVRYALSAGAVTTAAHATTAAIYYLYYGTAGALTLSAAPWDLLEVAPIALAYYNPSNNGGAAAGVLQYEQHPGVTGMSNATHKNLHNTRGTRLVSGCTASGYTLNAGGAANVNWTTLIGSVADEDIYWTVAAQALGGANNYRVLHLTGTTAAPVWNWTDSANYGILDDGTDIYYNQNNAGTWQLTAISSNSRWVNYYIVATTAYNTPQIIVVMGQKVYTTVLNAQAGNFATDCSNFGLFSTEGVVLYRVTYRRVSGDGAPGNAEISLFTLVSESLLVVPVPVAVQASAVVVDTTLFANILTVSDVNAQLCFNDLDAAAKTTATASTIVKRDASANSTSNNFISGYATTGTAATTTTLTVASKRQQYFTGSTTQTVLLPVTSTLALGFEFYIVNKSSDVVTVQSSGGNAIQAMAANTTLLVTCISTSGTGAASWDSVYAGAGGVTSVSNGGTGSASLTANAVILGNATSAVQTVAAGTSGNVLTDNGTTWTSSAPASSSGLGIGQTWTDVTSSRALTSTYTNSTGKPIYLNVGATGGVYFTFTINSVTFGNSGQGNYTTCNVIVQNGLTYRLDCGGTISFWNELR
jgi:hypothetical protein